MTVKHAPATPLPWKVSSDAKLRILGATLSGRPQLAGTGQTVNDALYIAHAANAYTQLIEAVRQFARDGSVNAARLLRNLGEEA